MKESEAIELFNERSTFIKEHYAGESKDYEEALEIGIQALEKQIPKKVVNGGKRSYKCPCCGDSAKTETGDSFIDYQLNYCDGCGQKLDWSDEE